MSRPSFRAFCWFTVAALGGLDLLLTGCPSTPPSGGGQQDGTDQQGDQLNEQGIPVDMAAFVVVGEENQFDEVSQTLPAVGGSVELPGVGSVLVPESDGGDGSTVTLVEASLTDAGVHAFTDTGEDFTPVGPVMQITVTADEAGPGYVLIELSAPDEQARLLVTAYLDADTETPAWTAIRGSFNPTTGMLKAPVGIGLLRPVSASAAPGKSAVMSQEGPTTHTGTVTIGVGGEGFLTRFFLIIDEPTSPLEVTAGDVIAVRARVGLQFSNITSEPLDSLDSLRISSPFGPRTHPITGVPGTPHRGVDYVVPTGTPVHAAGDGTVIYARCENPANCGDGGQGYGFNVQIDHGDGEVTRYAHLTRPTGPGAAPGCTDQGVCVDDPVTAGQVIAMSDDTGGSTNPHLHFETRQDGNAVDPEEFFDGGTVTVTMALALDLEIQEGTRQAIPLTRVGGIVSVEDLTEYVNIFDLSNVSGGEHDLDFVFIQADGTPISVEQVPLIVVDLNGRWLEHAGMDREAIVAQVGNVVSAVFVESNVCNHRDGLGTTSETTEDFVGTLDGLTITGMIKVCASGCQAGDPSCPPNGIVDVPFTLFVDPGGEILDGFWLGDDGNERVISLTRLEVQSE